MTTTPERWIVTGANRGIGLGLVRTLIERGREVVATARNPDEAADLHATGARVEQLDAADDASVRAFADRLGDLAIDALINNAGVFPAAGRGLDDLDPGDWTRAMVTNALGPVLVARALAPRMEDSARRLVLNISSQMGSIDRALAGGATGNYHYRASKAAENMHTALLASDLKPRGIAAVCMCPGWVRTDMGGADAALDPMESAGSIVSTAESFSIEDSGRYVDRTGETIPW
ncbi:MAG: SDR family oxidoreductase [Planctomycetota bacterium]